MSQERAEFLALEALVIACVHAFIDAQPSGRLALERVLAELIETSGRVHPKGSTAEQGDLQSAQLQEAFERLSQQVLRPKL